MHELKSTRYYSMISKDTTSDFLKSAVSRQFIIRALDGYEDNELAKTIVISIECMNNLDIYVISIFFLSFFLYLFFFLSFLVSFRFHFSLFLVPDFTFVRIFFLSLILPLFLVLRL